MPLDVGRRPDVVRRRLNLSLVLLHRRREAQRGGGGSTVGGGGQAAKVRGKAWRKRMQRGWLMNRDVHRR